MRRVDRRDPVPHSRRYRILERPGSRSNGAHLGSEHAHSISAGLDYPGVGPEHAYFKDRELVEYTSITDAEAVAAVNLLASVEGIIPALESAHALAWIAKEAAALRGQTVVLNLSGRGDKDVQQIIDLLDSDE